MASDAAAKDAPTVDPAPLAVAGCVAMGGLWASRGGGKRFLTKGLTPGEDFSRGRGGSLPPPLGFRGFCRLLSKELTSVFAAAGGVNGGSWNRKFFSLVRHKSLRIGREVLEFTF